MMKIKSGRGGRPIIADVLMIITAMIMAVLVFVLAFFGRYEFKNLEVRINGVVYEGWASLNRGAISKQDFAAGDELELGFGTDWILRPGDSRWYECT